MASSRVLRYLLIEPLWKLKLVQAHNPGKRVRTFNRTIVELKRTYHRLVSKSDDSFNRTIVELKLKQESESLYVETLF